MDSHVSIISVMLAVSDAQAAFAWYRDALGAQLLWDLGSVVGMRIGDAPVFLGEPAANGWQSPTEGKLPSCRIEVFCDDPDSFVGRAVNAGATGGVDEVQDHRMPWGIHRQGGFVDPFGHRWLVGDASPLRERRGGHRGNGPTSTST